MSSLVEESVADFLSPCFQEVNIASRKKLKN